MTATPSFRPLTGPISRSCTSGSSASTCGAGGTRSETYEEVAEHYLPSLEGRRATDLYLIVLGDAPDRLHPDLPRRRLPRARRADRARGGRRRGRSLHRGRGADRARARARGAARVRPRDRVRAGRGRRACVADPDVRNVASIRAFEKAGFRAVGEFVDPGRRPDPPPRCGSTRVRIPGRGGDRPSRRRRPGRDGRGDRAGLRAGRGRGRSGATSPPSWASARAAGSTTSSRAASPRGG